MDRVVPINTKWSITFRYLLNFKVNLGESRFIDINIQNGIKINYLFNMIQKITFCTHIVLLIKGTHLHQDKAFVRIKNMHQWDHPKYVHRYTNPCRLYASV